MKRVVSPAPDQAESAGAIRLGDCVLDLGAQRLLKGDTAVPLDPKAIGVLLHLAEAAPNFVSAEALLARTWQGTFVGDNALQQVIHRLRGAFGDTARSPRFIETLHRRGYRLLVTPDPAGPEQRTSAPAGPLARTGPVTLAILPFADRSEGTIDPYLSDGLTLALHDQLSKIAAIHKINCGALDLACSTAADPRAVCAELHAQCILQGTVSRMREQVAAAVQLIDAATSEQIWEATFDRSASEILELYCDIALAVAQGLGVRIEAKELVALRSVGTRDPAAHRLLQRATRYIPTSAMENRIAIELLESALDLDPGYANARALLAWYYGWSACSGGVHSLAAARAHAEQAVRTDGSSAWARFALASVLNLEARHFAALIELRHAVELDPSHSFALQDLSFGLNHMGHPDEALEIAIRNLRIDPNRALAHYHLAVPLLTLCEYERARLVLERALRRCLSLDDDPVRYRCEALLMLIDLLTASPRAALERAQALLETARTRRIHELAIAALDTELLLLGSDQVREELEHWYQAVPESPSMIAATQHTLMTRLAFALWQAGERARASELFSRMTDHNQKALAAGKGSPFRLLEVAAAYAVQGDTDAAIDWLEQACDAGYLQHRPIRLDPMFAGLRSDKRYEHIMVRMATTIERMHSAVEGAGLLNELDALIERDKL